MREERGLRVLEKRVLGTGYGPKRNKLTGGKRLHNEELYALYSSPKTIRVIKSRRISWAGHMGGRRVAYKGNLRKRNHLENLGVDRRRILK